MIRLPAWDDDLGPAPDVEYVHEDTPPELGERGPRGQWRAEWRARRAYRCDCGTITCPKEIREGELYRRLAVLERPKGPSRRGTVTVTRLCQAGWT